MKGKIAFEEHFAVEETLEETRAFAGDSGIFDDFARQILDLDDERLGIMDATGIELAILSLNAPGVQQILDAAEALDVAQKANETMAAAVGRHLATPRWPRCRCTARPQPPTSSAAR